MTTYTARVSREGRMWVVEVDGVGVTQARSLPEAQTMAADLITVMTDVEVTATEVQLEIDLPNGLTGTVQNARQETSAAEEAQRKAAALLRDAAARLRQDAGLTGRDTAFVLGVSEQRVSQLSAKATPAMASVRYTRTVKNSRSAAQTLRTSRSAAKSVGTGKSSAASALSQRTSRGSSTT